MRATDPLNLIQVMLAKGKRGSLTELTHLLEVGRDEAEDAEWSSV